MVITYVLLYLKHVDFVDLDEQYLQIASIKTFSELIFTNDKFNHIYRL